MAIELVAGDTRPATVFPCGQVLEEILGYDAAADPKREHPIWQLLAIPRPDGLRLMPEYWEEFRRPKREQLPPSPISLILQYKRPEYMQGARARQWPMWGAPYYRFNVVPHQQRVLKRLERAVGADVIVRYACPAFWRRTDFDRVRLGRTVIAESGFVSPASLSGHRVWTFDHPGADGRGNPSGTRHMFETVEQLLASLQRTQLGHSELVPTSRIDHQFSALAKAARQREPRVRSIVDGWIRTVDQANIGINGMQLEQLRAYASVLTLLHRIRASWFILKPT